MEHASQTIAQTSLRDRLVSLVAEWREAAEPARSGFIDPSDADLAREAGQREAYGNAANALQSVIDE
jgi:hypothetical protein